MVSPENPPSLALSDIMHHMSPSPGPQLTVSDEQQNESGLISNGIPYGNYDSSPNLISSELETTRIRRRLEEMGFSVPDQPDAYTGPVSSLNGSSRERELVEMILRLTEILPVDPAQLDQQAEVIAGLRAQRNYIAKQAEDERERWHAERESWDRTAEVLLSQRNKPARTDDIERLRLLYESENKNLRNKLQDTQRRLAMMENELLRIKPMLFVQPFSIHRDKGKERNNDTKNHTLVTIPEGASIKDGSHHLGTQPQIFGPNTKWKMAVPSPSTSASVKMVDRALSPVPPAPHLPFSESPTNSQPERHKRRFQDRLGNSRKRSHQTISNDARTELILATAKRVGRKRTAYVAGISRQIDHEREMLAQEQERIRLHREHDKLEQQRLDRVANGTFGQYYRMPPDSNINASLQRENSQAGPSTTVPPRTPKRSGSSYGDMGGSQPNSPLVYINVNPPTSQIGSPWAGSGVMGTPGQIRTALNRENNKSNQKAAPSNPPTPLASLLDAARMMGDDGRGRGRGGAENKAKNKADDKGKRLELESPLPKRRKTSMTKHTFTSSSAGGTGSGLLLNPLDRVRSALDVLADQADQAAAAPISGKGKADFSGRRKGSNSHGSNRGEGESDYEEDELDTSSEEDVPAATSRAIASSKGMGTRSRGGSTTRAKSKVVPSVVITRFPRQASSRKRAKSPAAPKAPSKPRGRPKGSTNTNNRHKSTPSVGEGGNARIISTGAPRIIQHPGYSPLDEAMASMHSYRPKTPERPREEQEHTQPRQHHHFHEPSMTSRPMLTSPSLKLNPVVAWGTGDRSPYEVDSDSSPVRRKETLQHAEVETITSKSFPRLDSLTTMIPSQTTDITVSPSSSSPSYNMEVQRDLQTNVLVSSPKPPSVSITSPEVETVSLPDPPLPATSSSKLFPVGLEPDSDIEMRPLPISHIDPVDVSIPVIDIHSSLHAEVEKTLSQLTPTSNIKALALQTDGDKDSNMEVDSEAVEEKDGEKEDNDQEGSDISSRDRPPRSRSPPPPDPSSPGSNGGPSPDRDDGQDPDADAEGEMEEEHEDGPSGSSFYQQALAPSNQLYHLESRIIDELSYIASNMAIVRLLFNDCPTYYRDIDVPSTKKASESRKISGSGSSRIPSSGSYSEHPLPTPDCHVPSDTFLVVSLSNDAAVNIQSFKPGSGMQLLRVDLLVLKNSPLVKWETKDEQCFQKSMMRFQFFIGYYPILYP